MAETQTTVTTKDVSLDDIFGTPTGANVILPEGKKQKDVPNLFARTPDATFLENQEETEEEEEAPEETPETPPATPEEEEEEEEEGNEGNPFTPPGTPESKTEGNKLNKGAMLKSLQSLIDKKVIEPFGGDDEKPLKDYSLQDIEDLIEANLNYREKKVREEFPQEFFQSLPNEMQAAVEYLSNGGQDMKSLFRVLAGVEETKELDPKNVHHQENIVRQYLRATKFGSEEEISEEIDGWRDRGELEAKASKFKPKLDKMQEDNIAAQLAHQEEIKTQRQAAAKTYMANVYNVLEKGELGSIKMDNKTQSMLYAGLVQPNYPSISGKATNLLGHLLEKYQFSPKEANHALVAEALWLLADPDGYRTKVRESGGKEATKKAVKLLKTEEQSGKKGLGIQDEDESQPGAKKRGLERPNKNLFKRV